jgi:hypothetical protein
MALGIVFGLLALVLIVAAVWLCLKRRRNTSGLDSAYTPLETYPASDQLLGSGQQGGLGQERRITVAPDHNLGPGANQPYVMMRD